MSGPFTCREAASLLADYQEDAIPWNLRIRTGMHLRSCPECRALFSDLEALSAILEHFAPVDCPPVGEIALANAMSRLSEPRNRRRLPATPIPDPLLKLLESPVDRPLHLMVQAHALLMNGDIPCSEPFLPEEVLAQLPPLQAWTWFRSGGTCRTLLCREPDGPSLSLVHMPPRFAAPGHVHLGTESLLVLRGELEHQDRCLTDGDWIHLESVSSHAPCALKEGCWCLVREEGSVRYEGRRGWFRNLRAG